MKERMPRAFLLFVAFMSLGGIVWGILYLSLGLHLLALIPLVYTIISIVNISLWLYKITNFNIARAVQTFASMVLPFILQWSLGGAAASGLVILWSVMTLMATVTFHKSNKIILWLFLFIGLTIFSVQIDNPFEVDVPVILQIKSMQNGFLLVNICIVVGMIFFLENYYIKTQQRWIEKLKTRHLDVIENKLRAEKYAKELFDTKAILEERQYVSEIINANFNSINDALDNSTIVTIIDSFGKMIKVNKKYCEVTGYAKKELLGQNYNFIHYGLHTDMFWFKVQRVMFDGGIWKGEVQGRTKTGAFFWTECCINPIYNKNGAMHQFLVIQHLITDKKEAYEEVKMQKEKLLASENAIQRQADTLYLVNKELAKEGKEIEKKNRELENLQKALNHSAVMAVLNLEGKLIIVNELFCKASQYTQSELIGKKTNILNSDYHPTSFWKEMWETITQGKSWSGDIRNKAKDGSFYWISTNINPVFDEDGILYKFLSISNVITKRKDAEAHIKEHIKVLQESQDDIYQSMLRERDVKEQLKDSINIIKKKSKDIESSLRYAKRVQRSIMPQRDTFSALFEDSFIFLQPKDKISGDFYWFETFDNNTKKLVVAADCTGHGVPGAILSVLGMNSLSEIIHKKEVDEPNKALEFLSKSTIKNLHQDITDNRDSIDMAMCLVDTEKKIIEFSGAKSPLIYIQNNELHFIKGDNLTVGITGKKKIGKSFTKHTIPITSTTHCYMLSDGFQDQFGGPLGRKFMIKRLKELLLEIHQKPMQEQKNILIDTLFNWQHHNSEKLEDQIDDILVMGFKIEI